MPSPATPPATPTPAPNGRPQSSDPGAVSPPHTALAVLRSLVPRFFVSVLNMPRSLWRVSPFQDPPPDPQSPPPHPQHSLSTSLSSSRPAPPSPAVSRRASRTSSRPVSTMASPRPLSAGPPSRPLSTRRAPAPTPDSDPTLVPTLATATTAPALIHIRDYGFAPADPRFSGQGPHVPRPNRPAILARRLACPPDPSPSDGDDHDDDDDRACDHDEDDEDDEDETEADPMSIDPIPGMWEDVDDDGANGWNGFKWGFARWAFARTSTSSPPSSAGFPTRGDLDRNFGTEAYEDMAVDVVEAFSDDDDDDNDNDDQGETEPLFPGLYRALYAFEPEGTAEMRLDEDQFVRVVGRGGGVGWAVVVKDGLKDTGVHALVPESYLEPVRLDGEEDDVA